MCYYDVASKDSYLSMYRINNDPFMFRGESFPNIYQCLYSYAFPSRHNLIRECNVKFLRDNDYPFKRFEIPEEDVLKTLADIIRTKYQDDPLFKYELDSINSQSFKNKDYKDPYFGHKHNMYGKLLNSFKQMMRVERRKDVETPKIVVENPKPVPVIRTTTKISRPISSSKKVKFDI